MAEGQVIVLFDEGCGVCTNLGAWLDRRAGIEAVPIGSPAGHRLLRDLPPQRRYDSVHVVDASGRRHSGAEGLPPLARAIPALAWTAPVLEALPAPLAWGYSLVTKHRVALSRLLGLDAAPTERGEPPTRASRGRAG